MRTMRAYGADDAAAGVAKLAKLVTQVNCTKRESGLSVSQNAWIETGFGCFFRHMRKDGYSLARILEDPDEA